ncbi:MAG TPA: redoxin domain-containing protein [Clostridiales bacterium]|nr:redoxin domain-containing protein [Clostridiales bacterium]
MKNKKTLIVIILVFALVVGGAAVLYNRLGKENAPEQLVTQTPEQTDESKSDENTADESQADDTQTNETEAKIQTPDFVVYDADGNEVRLSDYFGKPIVLNFWASWCGPCQMEMPDFNEKFLALGEEVNFLMVNLTDGSRETVEKASAFVTEKGYSFPVLYDTQSEAATTYGVYSIPTTYFIDSDGYVVTQASGAIDGDTLQRGIDMILPK